VRGPLLSPAFARFAARFASEIKAISGPSCSNRTI
jgi:hypothetical protein